VILEERVEPGGLFEVVLTGGVDDAAQSPSPQIGQIVWIQEEPDGVVAGIEFQPDPGRPSSSDGRPDPQKP
jgi:hypothetical protein